MEIQLSVIIINYNGKHFLKDCFESLQVALKNIQHEILVLDNNSQDGSCDFIKQNYPNVFLIESKINFGFGKGNNEAVKKAKGKYVLLFNNDTILLDDISPAIKILEERSDVGVIGIKMLNANKEYVPVFGNFPNVSNMFMMKKLQQMGEEFATGNFSKPHYEVDWLGGSFLLLSKELFQGVGGFDEDYFMYVEDVDFSKKIANRNLKRLFVPEMSYIHYVGFNKSKNPLLIKGYKIFIKKHTKGLDKLMLSLALTTNSMVKKLKLALRLD